MMACRRTPSVSFVCCLLATVMVFSGCLSRKNALPSDRRTGASTHKHIPKGTIITDASSSPKGVRAGKQLLEGYAAVLGVSPHDLKRPALYTFIDDWMGVPHRTGGTDYRGLDCSAFVGIAMQEIYGKVMPRASRDMAEHVKRKYERQLEEGDLVFFSFNRRDIDHVGIYLHNHKFVHVSTSKGVIISDLRDSWYYKYFTRAGTVR